MKSEYPSAEEVLDDLGGKITQGLALMVARTRADLDLYRRTFPEWVADSTDRELLNSCHDRAWIQAIRIFDGVSAVSFVDQPPTRELYVGTRYRLRVKSTMHELDEPADGAVAATTPILPPTEPHVPEIAMPSKDERDIGAEDQ